MISERISPNQFPNALLLATAPEYPQQEHKQVDEVKIQLQLKLCFIEYPSVIAVLGKSTRGRLTILNFALHFIVHKVKHLQEYQPESSMLSSRA